MKDEKNKRIEEPKPKFAMGDTVYVGGPMTEPGIVRAIDGREDSDGEMCYLYRLDFSYFAEKVLVSKAEAEAMRIILDRRLRNEKRWLEECARLDKFVESCKNKSISSNMDGLKPLYKLLKSEAPAGEAPEGEESEETRPAISLNERLQIVINHGTKVGKLLNDLRREVMILVDGRLAAFKGDSLVEKFMCRKNSDGEWEKVAEDLDAIGKLKKTIADNIVSSGSEDLKAAMVKTGIKSAVGKETPEAHPKGKPEAPEEEAAVTPKDEFQYMAEEMSRTRHDIAVRAATLMRGACSRKISFNAISKESAGKYIQGIYREIIDSDDFLSRLIDGIEEKKDGVFVFKQIFDEYVANISAEKSSEED